MADLKNLSEGSGIDYAEAMERFGGNEALYLRLAAKFLNDPHFAALDEALERGDLEAAQREAHSLKGVAGNLSFDKLFHVACEMNDALRASDETTARSLMPKAREAYERVCDTLRSLEG